MDTTIAFGTFNVGGGWGDHVEPFHASKQKFQQYNNLLGTHNKLRIQRERREEFHNHAEINVAEKMASQLHVIALQGLGGLERPFAQELFDRGFKIYHPQNDLDTAIAVNTNKFDWDSIENVSLNTPEQEIAAVEAKLRDSDTIIRFSSLSSVHFNLYHPDHQNKVYTNYDKTQMKSAHEYAKKALKADSESKAKLSFIGGDMRNNPDNFEKPFKEFSKKGYAILEPDFETSVNNMNREQTPSYVYRKTDYLFTKGFTKIQRIWNKIASFFMTTTEMKTSKAKAIKNIDFRLGENCSNHRPVKTTITITKHESTAVKIWKSVKGLFVG